jgi:D-alanyl-D-alanine carboxypeptidase (penicillin-binding protein 5/6)
MKRLALILSTLLLCFCSFAKAEILPLVPTNNKMIIPPPPTIEAKAFLLEDANSGAIIAQKNIHERIPPASLTKLMSLYLAFSAIKNQTIALEDKVRVSKKAWKTGGSRMFLKHGHLVTVRDLIQGVIVDSGNDATVALAEYIAGGVGPFIKMMNRQAELLHMKNSNFEDPTGLPSKNHYSTAYDLGILARDIVTQFPAQYHWFSQKHFTYNAIEQPNRNRLLWRYRSADGMKTGHTKAAKYCLIASAKKDGMRLISIVLGAPTDEVRAENSIKLLNYGFRFYRSHEVIKENQILTKIRVWKGKEKSVSLLAKNSVNVTAPAGSSHDFTIHLDVNKNIVAPIAKGQVLGTANIKQKETVIASIPLIAEKADPKGNFWRRTYDSVTSTFSHMLHRG